MNSLIKKSIAACAGLALVLIAYYGSYLPWQKSRMFIQAMQRFGQVKSLDEFKELISYPLDIPSPIGQEELVRNTASSILNVIAQSSANPELIKELVSFIESYAAPIIERGRGMSFNQNLYILGAINELAATKTGDPAYLESAKKYFLEGTVQSPRRPQFLYGLFDVYRLEKNVEKTKETAETILTYWENDERTKEALQAFLNEQLTK